MKRISMTALALLLVACGSSTSGGETGAGAGAVACPGECCPEAPYACQDLDEATCQSRSGCSVVKGAELAADGSTGAVVYLGCTSCQTFGSYETCVIHPDQPDTCYKVQSEMVPDGWTEDFECQACSSGDGG